jgi:DnaJ-class molecular chaperone
VSWDPYASLGLTRTSNQDDIRRAYRRLAKDLHPDVRPNDKAAEERFKRATAAFNLLTDPKQKARFDRGEIDADGNEKPSFHFGSRPRPGGPSPSPGGGAAAESAFDLGDIFSDLFGSGSAGRGGFSRMRGRDIRLPLEIDFIDAVNGAKRRMTLSDGRTLDVAIPTGVQDGQVLRLKSQGGPGVQGGPPGDALIELKVRPHAVFRREGDDIHIDFQISITEAIEGARIQVATPSGPVTVTIPEGANTGKMLRLKGKGIGGAGDQFVRLQVMLPESPDDELKKFIKKWAKRDYTPPRQSG